MKILRTQTNFSVMTLYQFNVFDELEQMETIWENGVLVAEPEDKINRYKLYRIGSFY